MPFVGLNKVTLTAKYLMFDETAAQGTVTFAPAAELRDVRDSAGNQIDIPLNFQTQLDVNGQISIVLPASNDPDVFPTGWTYRVTENIQGSSFAGPYTYDIVVPYDAPGGVLDLADIVPAVTLPDVSGYVLVSSFAALDSRVAVLEALGGTGTGILDGGTP